MKEIAAIFRSYFQRRFLLVIVLPSFFNFAIANAYLGTQHPQVAWTLFLYSVTSMAMAVGFNLLEVNVVDLIPNHRKFQVITAGLMLALFVIWPAMLLVLWNGPVLTMLALYLFFACLALWILSFSLAANGLFAIIGIPAILWLLFGGGRSPEASLLAQFGGRYLGSSWPVYVITASLLGFFYFGLRYMKATRVHSQGFSNSDYLECLKTQDSTDQLSARITSSAISHLAKANPKSSRFRLVRLFQFSLFSPMFGMYIFSGIFVLLATYLSFHGRVPLPGMNFFLPAYYFCPVTTAILFLSHRSRMPFIYLASNLPSRRSFLRATVLSYLLVVLKQTIFMTVGAILAHAVFPRTSWKDFPQLCILGLILSFIQVSFSLLTHQSIRSANALSWLIINVVIFAPIPLLAKLCSRAWVVSLVSAALFSGFLFWLAMRRWQKTELDFAAN
jgi:hypothetical protein